MISRKKVHKIKIVKDSSTNELENKVNKLIEEGWAFDSFHRAQTATYNYCVLLKEVEVDKEIEY